jgi:hypothetical protein
MPPTPTTEVLPMSDRAEQLYTTANGQIEQLVALLSSTDKATLHLPAPGREKLGDGTIGALVAHTADNYQRIAEFVQTSDRTAATHRPGQSGGHRIPRFMRALGHRPPEHSDHGPGAAAGGHGKPYTAGSVDAAEILKQLTLSLGKLTQVNGLTNSQLNAVPPDGSFRFCDGKRTLQQVLASLLNHQAHQVQAIESALTSSARS